MRNQIAVALGLLASPFAYADRYGIDDMGAVNPVLFIAVLCVIGFWLYQSDR